MKNIEEEKCKFCSIKDIEEIMYNDFLLERCSKCSWTRIPMFKFRNFILQYMHHKNYCKAKSVDYLEQLDDKEKKIALQFISEFDFRNWKASGPNEKTFCNFCSDPLSVLEHPCCKGFKVYFCNYCKSVYFKIPEFEKAAEALIVRARRKQSIFWFIFFLKELLFG